MFFVVTAMSGDSYYRQFSSQVLCFFFLSLCSVLSILFSSSSFFLLLFCFVFVLFLFLFCSFWGGGGVGGYVIDPLWGIKVTLPLYSFSNLKSSTTHSHHCLQYVGVSKLSCWLPVLGICRTHSNIDVWECT